MNTDWCMEVCKMKLRPLHTSKNSTEKMSLLHKNCSNFGRSFFFFFLVYNPLTHKYRKENIFRALKCVLPQFVRMFSVFSARAEQDEKAEQPTDKFSTKQ